MNTKQVFVYRKYRNLNGDFAAELLDVLNFTVIDLTGLQHSLQNNSAQYGLKPNETLYFRFTGVDQEFQYVFDHD